MRAITTQTLGNDREPNQPTPNQPTLASAYQRVRAGTEHLSAPLSAEDQTAQSMQDASPTKWHRAHTTWFFEQFVLAVHDPSYVPDAQSSKLFNSYYNSVGTPFPRHQRGLLTRPSSAEVTTYRQRVDRAMVSLLRGDISTSLASIVVLGFHHEQQHQELLLTDVKHLLSHHPDQPAYMKVAAPPDADERPLTYARIPGACYRLGHAGKGFAFDNEGPLHDRLIDEFDIASRLVSEAEYQDFIDDGGYSRPELWLSAGWDAVRKHDWTAPLYWTASREQYLYTMNGARPLGRRSPVTHVSYYEADAYARWSDARLSTEFEWEVACRHLKETPPIGGGPALHPETQQTGADFFGSCWQWTQSDYAPYPRFRASPDAVGEYNGKFMSGQYVLRGSSALTPDGHARPTYRNFFPPTARWQFSGIRLARDVP
ncbi:MAG: ergothioneine biosynthesis protein EgtB [Polyangiaceae bacterium]|nr:ergothioneine biosynthesis protein EgtB [Polyangiaceae bacterium]